MNDGRGSCHPTNIISKNNTDNGRKMNNVKQVISDLVKKVHVYYENITSKIIIITMLVFLNQVEKVINDL